MRREPSAAATLLDAVSRRRAWLHLAECLAAAVTIAVAVAWISSVFQSGFVSLSTGIALGVLAGGLLYFIQKDQRTSVVAATEIERLRPSCRNVVVTSEELRRHPDRASAWMTARVNEDASRAVQGLGAGEVVPARRPVAAVAFALLISTAAWLGPGPRQAGALAGQTARQIADAVTGTRSARLSVTLRPPAYSALPERTVIDPERLEVLEGTRLRFTVSGAGAARLRFGASLVGAFPAGGDAVETVARDGGYFAIEHDGVVVRLIALLVTRDRSPSVKIEQPARDLLLPEASRSIPIRVSATDDLGLAALDLRYTKVSGSGEQFEFHEGVLPLSIARASAREWRADTQMALARLNLEPGDSLVYRAVARDGRSGDEGLGASDTYFIEIAGPGQVPLEGVEMPPEEQRYALSQQMIVLKIERLIARQASMPRATLVEESALIAAEQRSVRANFIFLLGGHVEDEEVEAEQSSEISEGRLQNTARRDISAAIGHMTRAEQGLVAVNTSQALPPARHAVDALQRAFGRSRYLLRSLASRSRLDPARRLTGTVAGAEAWRRVAADSDPREGEAVRALLARLVAAHEALARGQTTRVDLATLAEQALAIDPGAARWSQMAIRIQSVVAQGVSRPAEAIKILEGVIAEISATAGDGLVPRAGLAPPRSPLERAWGVGGTK